MAAPSPLTIHWRECFHRALSRVSILLNTQRLDPAIPALLAGDDRALRRRVTQDRLLLYRLNEEAAEELAYRDYADFFYGTTHVEERELRMVAHYSRPSFIQAFIDGYRMPKYVPAQLGLTTEDVPDRDVAFGANYLVKNLWHNLVHELRQDIHAHNFREFKGAARDQSDFAADNLGAIAHLLSYGHTVTADALRREDDPNMPIVHTIRRNRCNRMFGVRTERSGEEVDDVELDWRYRRSVAVYLSAWLLAAGRAVASISVHGGRKLGGAAGRRVVVELNGVYFATHYEERKPLGAGDSDDARQQFRTHVRLIAGQVDAAYRDWLASSAARRERVRELLATELQLLGLTATPHSVAAT